ncbi:MAG: hypothetical protein KBB55_01120 [Candidatus Buchananbacteria bacterium]|nr:hypothetical protein [Candidatus Buchananbacteria bacterium]
MRWIFGLTLCLLFVAVPLLPAAALTISPLMYDPVIAPGASAQETITITNDTNAAQAVRLTVERFKPRVDGGSAELIVDPTAASWIRPAVTQLQLAAGESRDVPFEVIVPPTADAGGVYLALVVETQTMATQPGAANIRTRVGALIFLTVLGDIKRSLTIENFAATALRGQLPVSFTMTLNNTGTVHLQPEGSVVIKNAFGNVVAAVPVSEDQITILPGSQRTLKVTGLASSTLFSTLASLPIGPWQTYAEVTLTDGTTIQSVPQTVWLYDWRLLAVIGIGLLIGLGLVANQYRRS